MSVALYKPFGIAGIVIGTGVSSAVMTLAQMYFLRRELHGRLDVRRTLVVVIQVTLASALLAGAAYGTWYLLDQALGVGLLAQLLSVGVALSVGFVSTRSRFTCCAYRRRARSKASSWDGLDCAVNGRK